MVFIFCSRTVVCRIPKLSRGDHLSLDHLLLPCLLLARFQPFTGGGWHECTNDANVDLLFRFRVCVLRETVCLMLRDGVLGAMRRPLQQPYGGCILFHCDDLSLSFKAGFAQKQEKQWHSRTLSSGKNEQVARSGLHRA